MPSFKNYDSLEKYLSKQIKSIMHNEMADVVKETMSTAVEEDVYDSIPPPKLYRRRGSLGSGLADTRTMQSDVYVNAGEVVLEVESETKLNNDYGINPSSMSLQEIVISGNDYMFPGSHEKPRDFVEGTRQRLVETDSVRETMRSGLERIGIHTE